MEGTEVQQLFIYIPVIGVVLFVVLVFACGFRSSTEPPSSMFEDENEKRNKRGRRKKVSTSELKPSTNGHVKLPADSPREIKQVKGQKVEQDSENTPKVSPKKEKSVKSKSSGGKDEEIVKKPTLANGGAKDREKDEGDAWITVTAPRKDKKTNKSVQNGVPAKPTNKSPKVSPKGSGGEKAAQKGKKEETAKNNGSKESPPKQKGSPKKVVEDIVKASSAPTQSAKAPESPVDKGKKRKKKGQPEGEETTNQMAENTTGLTNGSAEDSKLTNQQREGGEAEEGFTPGKSRKNKKKQKTTQEESTVKTSPADNKTQKSKTSSPESSPAKSTKKSAAKPSSPSQNKSTKIPQVEGSPTKSSKGNDAKVSSPSKIQKNTKKENAIPAKSDTKPLKDKKSTEKASSSASSSLDTSPAKSKSSSDSSPSKSSKKRGNEKTSTQQKKPDDKPLPDSSKSQESTSPEVIGEAKSKTKKKSKKESTPSSPTTPSKQPATPEAVQTIDVKVDSVDVKTNGKKNKRKGGGDTKGKPIDTVNTASHSLPPANAKDVSSAITPDKRGDKPPSGSPTRNPDKEPATVVAPKESVPEAEDNDNWVEAKPVKKRKKVRRDL